MPENQKNVSYRPLIFKILTYAFGFYLLIIAVALAITGYIFFTLDSYKTQIQNIVYQHSGYKLEIKSIETKFDHGFFPEVIFEGVHLYNPLFTHQDIKFGKIDVALSYSSFWDLEPIFRKIEISSTKLDIRYHPDGSIVVNGININNPDRQTLENTKNSSIDIERWLLKQHRILLNEVDLRYLDTKNGLPQVELPNLRIGLERNLLINHRLYIDVSSKNYQSVLEAELNWRGGKFEDWKSWSSAHLTVSSFTGLAAIANPYQSYSPGFNVYKDLNATTALNASMKNGRLEDLDANFDVNNFKLALANVNLENFPRLGGNLSVKLYNDSYYLIKANNLVMVTSAGTLFDNSQISGDYTIGKHGRVELTNTNLVALNNLLTFFDTTHGLSIDGMVNSVSLSWFGSLPNPPRLIVNAKFNDISLNSTRPEYPSLSHVSGDVAISNGSGKLNLSLANSVLNYDKLFLIPYRFKSLKSEIDWTTDAKNKLTVVLHKTPLETVDFKGWVSGEYTNNPNNPKSPSYLTMYAHVDRVLTHVVGDYLPKAIPMSVHKWLNMGLAGGYGKNANMTLKGPLANFPFRDGNGLFYITADLDNAKLQYVKDWPPLENIYGQFILKNTNITIKADSANLVHNQLERTVVVIPDYANPDGVYLTADGQAHGTTPNFMDYLRQTPVSKVIGDLPDKLASSGNGALKIHLMVPFKEPKHTEVNGTYSFEDNNIQFDMPVPLLTHVNGDLKFSQHGVEISDLETIALNSHAKLSATTTKDGQMHFEVNSPDLDYQAVAKMYIKPFSQLISGRAPSIINFSIGKKGIGDLTAQSQLVGVNLDFPKPLAKLANESQNFNLLMQPYGYKDGVIINWSLGALLRGTQTISSKSATASGQIAVGANCPYLEASEPGVMMTVNVNLPQVSINDWLSTVNFAIKTMKEDNESESDAIIINSLLPKNNILAKIKKHYQILPIQAKINTDKFMFGKTDLANGSANIIVHDKQTYFNMFTPITSGQGDFGYANKTVHLELDKYMLYKKAHKKASESNETLSFVIPENAHAMPNLPDIYLNIHNLFFENHNLGQLSTKLHQDGRTLYLESGTLTSDAAQFNFSGANYCSTCAEDSAYVEFKGSGKVNNLGNLVEALDLGRVVNNGHGNLNANLQWNGGFQNFNMSQTVGSMSANIAGGKFLKVNPGILGGFMSIINLQGLFEMGNGDVQDIFKSGFYFNSLDIDASIIATQVELNKVEIDGPLADVSSFGQANFGTNKVDAYVSIAPKLGVAVAITAGVVTLDPVVGIAVYLGELLFDDPQNKLFSMDYHIYGNLKKPIVEKTNISDQLAKNANSMVGQ